jgi:hypothetical protein
VTLTLEFREDGRARRDVSSDTFHTEEDIHILRDTYYIQYIVTRLLKTSIAEPEETAVAMQ